MPQRCDTPVRNHNHHLRGGEWTTRPYSALSSLEVILCHHLATSENSSGNSSYQPRDDIPKPIKN
ncbi:hypothetical protein J6590_052789 [Homalodisca vitripennis]|nr:hypothetical protein J6590_052789 [Homalodisca vitripennis]